MLGNIGFIQTVTQIKIKLIYNHIVVQDTHTNIQMGTEMAKLLKQIEFVNFIRRFDSD